MTLIVDEVMLREPNLLVPGKKPVGPVKIDWSHPITDRLVAAYIFRANEPAAVDLVTGAVTPFDPSMGASPEGVDMTSVSNVTDLPAPSEIAGSSQFTFVTRARSTDGAAIQGKVLFSYRNDTSTAGLLQVMPWDSYTGDGIRIYFDGGNRLNQDAGATHFNTNVHDISTIGFITDDATAYIDNDPPLESGLNTERFLTATPTAMSIGGRMGTTNLINSSYLHHLYVYSRVLTEPQIRDLHADPYQFLIPA